MARSFPDRRLVRAALLALLGLAFACSSGDDGPPSFPDGSLFQVDGRPGSSDDDSAPQADANLCATQPCDIYDQCGCAAGQACDVDPGAEGETACREVEAFGGHGDSCADLGLEGCRPGFVCVSDEPSFCRKYCRSDDECPGDGARCRINLTGHDLSLCDFHCNAARTDGDGCPEARPGCYFFRVEEGSSEHFTTCEPPGESGHGQPCPNGRLDCQAGHSCLVFGGESQECRRTCIIGQGGCPSGTSCQQYPGLALVGDREYGYCN